MENPRRTLSDSLEPCRVPFDASAQSPSLSKPTSDRALQALANCRADAETIIAFLEPAMADHRAQPIPRDPVLAANRAVTWRALTIKLARACTMRDICVRVEELAAEGTSEPTTEIVT